jgi:hypothetical protein
MRAGAAPTLPYQRYCPCSTLTTPAPASILASQQCCVPAACVEARASPSPRRSAAMHGGRARAPLAAGRSHARRAALHPRAGRAGRSEPRRAARATRPPAPGARRHNNESRHRPCSQVCADRVVLPRTSAAAGRTPCGAAARRGSGPGVARAAAHARRGGSGGSAGAHPALGAARGSNYGGGRHGAAA